MSATTKMKNYTLRVSVELLEGAADAYDPPKPVRFKLEERLPANIDAQKHLRARIGEELKRNFDALPEPIANKTPEAEDAHDPLEA